MWLKVTPKVKCCCLFCLLFFLRAVIRLAAVPFPGHVDCCISPYFCCTDHAGPWLVGALCCHFQHCPQGGSESLDLGALQAQPLALDTLCKTHLSQNLVS